jgi:hypothetical protein
MRLFHICSTQAYDALYKKGYLSGDGRRIPWYFKYAYQWMTEQMRKRLPPKPAHAGVYPVWAWHTFGGKRALDLRHRGFGTQGNRTVRLTIEVPDAQVLLSNYDDWHNPLNNFFLTDNEAESDLWDARRQIWPPEEYEAARRLSWEKIFDLQRIQDPEWGRPGPPQYVQACFWLLEAHMVRKERWFTAR